ncbi:MAG TPA: nucleotidyltransferase domain-containing protein, partial [Ktedonobacterales bacterium]|nr:nucleotidyltransferase domain-containing protein [Ktedonobacterales bacterium]
MLPLPSLTALLTLFARWAALREEIVALALVGSYARGAARPDSDVDLVVLTTDPDSFRQQTDWVQAIPWSQLQLQVVRWQDEEYGPL